MTDAELAQAARFEVHRREESYPKLVASGKLTANDATIDFQAWSVIADWLESGQFRSIDAGGIDGLTVINMARAEVAADAALAKITAKAEKASADKAPAAWARQAALTVIARRVRLRRESADMLNRQLRQRAERGDLAAAAA